MDTQPEKAVRSLLHRMGYRFRLHGKDLPSRISSCLNINRYIRSRVFLASSSRLQKRLHSQSREEFWQKKFADNIERHRTGTEPLLRKSGWRPLVIYGSANENLAKPRQKTQKTHFPSEPQPHVLPLHAETALMTP